MEKDFDTWNILKKKLDSRKSDVFSYPREIWWCSLGINIGAEINGKNKNFERPVLILKFYNKQTLLVLPITTKEKNDKFHYRIKAKNKTVWVKLTQPRVISNKRLRRKIDTLNEVEFQKLKLVWKASL